MTRSRRNGIPAAVLTATLGVGALVVAQPHAAAGGTAVAATPAPTPSPVEVVGFGDSVPLGKHCDGCGNLFALYAKGAAAPGAAVTVVNLAKGNTTSADALKTMRT